MESSNQNQKPPQAPTPPVVQSAKTAAPQVPSGGINLIPEIAENEIKSGVYKRKVNVGALAALAIVGIVIIGILIFQGALALQANSIRNRTSKAESRIRQNQAVEIKALATKEKLDKVAKLLAEAIPASTFVEQISKATVASSPVVITNLTISQNGEAFVDGTVTNSEVFKQWVANLTSKESSEYFAKINAASLTGNPSEGYKFAFKLSFLKKGVYTPNAE